MEKQNQSELELLHVLAESEADVAAVRVAPIENKFRDLRVHLIEKKTDEPSKRHPSFQTSKEFD